MVNLTVQERPPEMPRCSWGTPIWLKAIQINSLSIDTIIKAIIIPIVLGVTRASNEPKTTITVTGTVCCHNLIVLPRKVSPQAPTVITRLYAIESTAVFVQGSPPAV